MEKDGFIAKFHAEIGAARALHVSKTELSARGGKNRKKPYNVSCLKSIEMEYLKLFDFSGNCIIGAEIEAC